MVHLPSCVAIVAMTFFSAPPIASARQFGEIIPVMMGTKKNFELQTAPKYLADMALPRFGVDRELSLPHLHTRLLTFGDLHPHKRDHVPHVLKKLDKIEMEMEKEFSTYVKLAEEKDNSANGSAAEEVTEADVRGNRPYSMVEATRFAFSYFFALDSDADDRAYGSQARDGGKVEGLARRKETMRGWLREHLNTSFDIHLLPGYDPVHMAVNLDFGILGTKTPWFRLCKWVSVGHRNEYAAAQRINKKTIELPHFFHQLWTENPIPIKYLRAINVYFTYRKGVFMDITKVNYDAQYSTTLGPGVDLRYIWVEAPEVDAATPLAFLHFISLLIAVVSVLKMAGGDYQLRLQEVMVVKDRSA